MSLAKSIGSFADVKQVLDAVVKRGGGTYVPELGNPSAATRWRHRAYRLRQALLQLNEKAVAEYPGVAPSTPYDAMFLTLDFDKVIIAFRRPAGILTDVEGLPIDLELMKQADELELAAQAFADTLTGEAE